MNDVVNIRVEVPSRWYELVLSDPESLVSHVTPCCTATTFDSLVSTDRYRNAVLVINGENHVVDRQVANESFALAVKKYGLVDLHKLTLYQVALCVLGLLTSRRR